MSFKSRVLLASVLLVWAPLVVLAAVTRHEMGARLTEEHSARVDALMAVLDQDLADRRERIGNRLADLSREIVDDNRFRLAAVEGLAAERGYVLGYAERAMRLAGLDMLQIHDPEGRILSSGHFRNEFDRMEPGLPRALAAVPGHVAIVRARRPTGPFLCLAALQEVPLGSRIYTLIGGEEVDHRFLMRLTRDPSLTATLVCPGGVLSSDAATGERVRAMAADSLGMSDAMFPASRFLVDTKLFPYIGDGEELQDPRVEGVDTTAAGLQEAGVFVAAYSREPLRRLLRRLDVWLALVLLGAGTGTFVLARWTASRVVRPVEELARKTLRVELGRSGVDFATTRSDELGALSRFLAGMMRRLDQSARKLRDAERRATLGDLARQVNHDMKNGLTPIRNVFRHLTQVAGEDPGALPTVFQERRSVLDTSLRYLEDLAGNVAKLYRPGARERCDLNAVAARVAGSREEPQVRFHVRGGKAPPVLADPLALNRIVENLVANAVDSVAASGGDVTVETEAAGDGKARLVVADTGPGLSPEDQKRIFDDFYTTKEGGAGLGLSIVRRMVSDCEGTVRVESEPGRGARFIVEFPAADVESAPPNFQEGTS